MGLSSEMHELPYTPIHFPILATVPGMHRYFCDSPAFCARDCKRHMTVACIQACSHFITSGQRKVTHCSDQLLGKGNAFKRQQLLPAYGFSQATLVRA